MSCSFLFITPSDYFKTFPEYFSQMGLKKWRKLCLPHLHACGSPSWVVSSTYWPQIPPTFFQVSLDPHKKARNAANTSLAYFYPVMRRVPLFLLNPPFWIPRIPYYQRNPVLRSWSIIMSRNYRFPEYHTTIIIQKYRNKPRIWVFPLTGHNPGMQ